jgi:hypothetical protein
MTGSKVRGETVHDGRETRDVGNRASSRDSSLQVCEMNFRHILIPTAHN